MPKALLGTTAYDLPPAALRDLSIELYDYLLMMHARIFGLAPASGDLDTANIAGTVTNHALLTNVLPYQHHGATTHSALSRATAVADAAAAPAASSTAPAASIVSVAAADADATYDAGEVLLLNELKGDVNQLVLDVNAAIIVLAAVRADTNAALAAVATLVTKINAALGALRTAQLMSL